MIILLPLSGLALAGSIFMRKNDSKAKAGKRRSFPKSVLKPKPSTRPVPGKKLKPSQMKAERKNFQNPLEGIFRAVSSTMSAIGSTPTEENYEAIVKSFLPAGAKLLKPQYPDGSGRFYLTDLDGDSQSELITSYKLDNETTTLILKKQDGKWNKVTELKAPTYGELNYKNFTDITGEGKKQMLLGWKTSDGAGKLYGYSLQNSEAKELFNRDYSMVEVLEPSRDKSSGSKAQLAIWNNGENGLNNIEVMSWNGSGVEPLKSPSSYYHNRVLPYLGAKVRQTPNNSANWYNLADALIKAGMYRDAAAAIQFGLSRKPIYPSEEEFLALKNSAMEKMK